MIETLRIENLAIVDELELEFGPGLNVITGETGAGKSVILGALSLLAGQRAGRDALREGAKRGGVEAVFRTDGLLALEAQLAALGIEPEAEAGDAPEAASEDDGARELGVQRQLLASGRSRARVAGELVPLSTLASLLGPFIEISSQHSGQALLRAEEHGRLLDEAGGHARERTRVAEAYAALKEASGELDALRGAAADREQRRDFLAYQLEEIDAADLQPGELAALDEEHRRLAHSDDLDREARGAYTALAGDDAGDRSAVDRVGAAARALESVAKLDSRIGPQADRLFALETELRDVAGDLERTIDAFERDPARLAQIEERLAELDRLRRKYGREEAEIFEKRDAMRAEWSQLEGASERTDALEAEIEKRAGTLAKAAKALTAKRKKSATALGKRIAAPLAELGMPDARFAAELKPAQPPAVAHAACGPGGAESPEFLFSANPGSELQPLRRVASGGELSRVTLALKNALRGAGRGMVLVFDEVDTGLGGGVAERVGRVLAELAAEHQVLCITHLPQIAALGDRHFRVRKDAGRGGSRVSVEPVEGEARVEEIARMAGGEDIAEATREHARALLDRR